MVFRQKSKRVTGLYLKPLTPIASRWNLSKFIILKQGKGKTRKRKNGDGKAEKRVKCGKAEKRVKGGKAEKRVKGGKKGKRRKSGKKGKRRKKQQKAENMYPSFTTSTTTTEHFTW